MAKIRKEGGKRMPAISTASLPDIIFMLLIFFMVTTTMREQELKVVISVPEATEVNKLENKSLVSYLYIGKPVKKLRSQLGEAPRIQLNDAFAKEDDIAQWVEQEKDRRSEDERNRITWSFKVDRETEMGIVTDVKQELRQAQALKINYSSTETDRIVD